jgi:hypothetical protein
MKNITGLLAISLMILAGLACSGGNDTAKANELVDEANKFLTEANNSAKKMEAKGKEFDTKVAAVKGEADLKEARDLGKELLPLYESMKENFQKAGEKFTEAGKLAVNEKYKEYLETKGQEMKKRSELAGELKAIPQALDEAKSEKAYKEAIAKIAEKVQKMNKEAKELADKGDKIQKDNPDIIKQS